MKNLVLLLFGLMISCSTTQQDRMPASAKKRDKCDLLKPVEVGQVLKLLKDIVVSNLSKSDKVMPILEGPKQDLGGFHPNQLNGSNGYPEVPVTSEKSAKRWKRFTEKWIPDSKPIVKREKFANTNGYFYVGSYIDRHGRRTPEQALFTMEPHALNSAILQTNIPKNTSFRLKKNALLKITGVNEKDGMIALESVDKQKFVLTCPIKINVKNGPNITTTAKPDCSKLYIASSLGFENFYLQPSFECINKFQTDSPPGEFTPLDGANDTAP